MKQIIPLVALFVLFAGCDVTGDANNPENRESVVPVEKLTISSINSSFSEANPLVTDPDRPIVISGIGEARFTVYIEVEPLDAPWKVTCVSDNPDAIYYDSATFQIVGNRVGDARLSFSTVGKMANGQHAIYDVYVRSNVLDLDKLVRWEFSTVPDGWSAEGNTVETQTNAAYLDKDGKGYTMTLLGQTRTMVINPSTKALRVGGGGNYATIADIPGPYNMQISFAAGGGDGTDHRWTAVQIGSTWYNGDNTNTYNADRNLVTTQGGGTKTLNITHNGTGTDLITLRASGNLYIYDVFIELP